MTTEQKVARRKLGLLGLAVELGNAMDLIVLAQVRFSVILPAAAGSARPRRPRLTLVRRPVQEAVVAA